MVGPPWSRTALRDQLRDYHQSLLLRRRPLFVSRPRDLGKHLASRNEGGARREMPMHFPLIGLEARWWREAHHVAEFVSHGTALVKSESLRNQLRSRFQGLGQSGTRGRRAAVPLQAALLALTEVKR